MGFSKSEALAEFNIQEASSYRIVERGVSNVRIKRSGLEMKQNVADEDYASVYPVITHNSHIYHLEAEFHDSDEAKEVCRNEGTTQIIPTVYTDDGRLATVAQAAGYAERSALIVASNRWDFTPEELEEFGHKIEPALFSAHLNTFTRTGYVAATLAGLQVASEYTDGVALAIEHNTPAVSQNGAAVSRSIPRPHTTLAVIDVSHFKNWEKDIPHLQEEQQMLTEEMRTVMALQMYAYLRRNLGRKDANQLLVAPQHEEPLGYRIDFRGITPDKLTDPKTVKDVTRVMNTNHAGYEKFTRGGYMQGPPSSHEGFRRFFVERPQPAQRVIYHFHPKEQTLSVAFSPIASRAGGMEAMGIDLRRDVEYPMVHPEEEVTLFQKNTGERIQESVDRLGIPRKSRTGVPPMPRRRLLFVGRP